MFLYKNVSDIAEILDNGEKTLWEEKFSLLPEFALNEGNILMLNPVESLGENHRHHFHAMSIYPLNFLNYKLTGRDKVIIDAIMKIWKRSARGFGGLFVSVDSRDVCEARKRRRRGSS